MAMTAVLSLSISARPSPHLHTGSRPWNGLPSKAAALGGVSWAKGLVWLMWPCYRMGRCERSRLVIMPV